MQWLGDVREGGCPGGEIRRGRPRVHAVSGKGGSMARDGTCVHNRAPAGTHARMRPGPWPGAPTPHLHCLWSSPLRGFAPSYLHHATGLPRAHPSSLVTNASTPPSHTHTKKNPATLFHRAPGSRPAPCVRTPWAAPAAAAAPPAPQGVPPTPALHAALPRCAQPPARPRCLG